ncbi:hypothetical protein GW17_00061769, partial [Ensete ventricosum]
VLSSVYTFLEHKYEIVKRLQARKHICGMTGDGVNDAPALKKADIGIAVADATDAARSASDIVLTEPGLSVIISAVLTSRIGWRWAGVIWLYNLIFYFPLDIIKFFIRYALSGKAWELVIEQRIAFTRKKDFGKEERELRWAHAQRTLHGLQPPDTKFSERSTVTELNQIAEEAKRRAEIARCSRVGSSSSLYRLDGGLIRVLRPFALEASVLVSTPNPPHPPPPPPPRPLSDMSAIVATSEEDPALAVIRFTAELSWADAGPEVKKINTYCGDFAHLF